MSKKVIFAIVLLVGVLAVYYLYGRYEVKKVERPNIETPQVRDTIDYIKGVYDEQRKVLHQQLEDMVKANQEKDNVIRRLQTSRRANNDNVKDEDLLMSIDKSLDKLEKLGY